MVTLEDFNPMERVLPDAARARGRSHHATGISRRVCSRKGEFNVACLFYPHTHEIGAANMFLPNGIVLSES